MNPPFPTSRRRRPIAGVLIVFATISISTIPARADSGLSAQGTVLPLFARDLIGQPGKEVTMLTVEYPPGGASSPHRHDAQVFVYVLAGSLRMQVKGAAPVTLEVGDTFYEAPNDVHTVSANASNSLPAKILVVMIKDKNAGPTKAVPENHP